MATPKELRSVFVNPPMTGSGQGGPRMIENSMGPLPKPDRANEAIGYGYDRSGCTLAERRKEREQERMTPHQQQEAMMADWNKVPPPSTGPGAQTSLRESFEKGEESARRKIQHSGEVDQNEFRNYSRGFVPSGDPLDPVERTGAYDIAHAAMGGDPHGRVT